MRNASLIQVIQKSTLSGGCGMSLRPAYYSGCGLSSLTAKSLALVYQEIKRQADMPPIFGHKEVPEDAHEEYLKLVMSLVPLTATDFLIGLNELEEQGWKFVPRTTGIPGIDLGDNPEERDLLAQATVCNVLSGREAPDMTYSTVWNFLFTIGRLKEISRHPQHPQHGSFNRDDGWWL